MSRHSRQPPSDVRAPTVVGVESSVMKLTRKVSKQRCLSFSGRSFIVLPRPFDRPRRPIERPWTGVLLSGRSMVLPREAESRLHAGAP